MISIKIIITIIKNKNNQYNNIYVIHKNKLIDKCNNQLYIVMFIFCKYIMNN